MTATIGKEGKGEEE